MELDHDLQSLQEMRNAVDQANNAQKKLESYTQEQVDRIIQEVADAAFEQSTYLAKMAVDETGMGVMEHKKLKNKVGSRDVYESIKDEKTVGMIGEDTKNKVTEFAYPFGVVAGIIPTTNPTSTAVYKTLISLKSRNAIVVSPHPSAVKCTIEALKICHDAAVKAGAPEGIVGWISKPSMPATNELMSHKDVDVILATGGGGLVRAAYSSGKPAYGVGPGNVPVYLEKSCDVQKSVQMIVDSKSFDNGTICATEQALVIDQNIKEMSVREFKKNGSYLLNEDEKKKVEKVISPTKGKLNPKIVGKSAVKIAEMAGLEVPENTRLLIAEETKVGKEIPFSIEKLSPIFPLYTVKNEEEAEKRCIELLNLGGRGHSFSLHTNDDDLAKRFAEKMPVSRMLVNTLSSIGAVGATTGLKASMTLGCGSYGSNITSDNITARHLMNVKRMAYGIKDVDIPRPSKNITSQDGKESTESNQVEKVVSEVMKEVDEEQVDASTLSEIVEKVLQNQ
ncbi:acetaldehyde dehydrogenase (acetylating) [Pontibacillus yanchengensis]|uniref:Acetaldehyde dehydrogenase (Acetylating) n=1 Tax=Pontibacillus yanchengensis TaxID=462910 RepID=A0A6I5A646_9BACI|nr:acetaldehyde dehydrogenase (acetylating) [Pontibacillus yanchengensis]MYL35764.1 acetaldehyde dehydrogenase (acetylating) [Pontibacillus yanchengensis]